MEGEEGGREGEWGGREGRGRWLWGRREVEGEGVWGGGVEGEWGGREGEGGWGAGRCLKTAEILLAESCREQISFESGLKRRKGRRISEIG